MLREAAERLKIEILRDGPDFNRHVGLCSNLDNICRKCFHVDGFFPMPLNRHFESWEFYSGDIEYPVPGLEGKTAKEAYHRKFQEEDFYEGRNLELRLDLLDHIIREELALELRNSSR